MPALVYAQAKLADGFEIGIKNLDLSKHTESYLSVAHLRYERHSPIDIRVVHEIFTETE